MQWRLFESILEADVQRLVAVSRRRRFGPNEVVFHRDDPADSLHLIANGRFAIRIVTPVGDTVTIAVRGTFSFSRRARLMVARVVPTAKHTVGATDGGEALGGDIRSAGCNGVCWRV
jgi:CRP-like cAMP-binding protein